MRALVIVLALLAARPADACKWEYVSMFRQFDEAPVVVRARVRAPGGKLALAVLAPLKGKPTKKQIMVGRETSCSPRMRGTGIAFFTEDMMLVGLPDAFVTGKSAVAILVAYAAATTDAERAAILVEAAVASDDTNVRYAAEVALAEDPRLLATLTQDDRDRLIADKDSPRATTYLPIVLARLGVDAKQLAGTAAELAAERKFEAMTKPAELADIIAATPTGYPSARAVAAFERCERIRNKRLASFRNVVTDGIERGGTDWHVLADVCRSGAK